MIPVGAIQCVGLVLLYKTPWGRQPVVETCRSLIFVMNCILWLAFYCILWSASVGWCIECKNGHGLSNLKIRTRCARTAVLCVGSVCERQTEQSRCSACDDVFSAVVAWSGMQWLLCSSGRHFKSWYRNYCYAVSIASGQHFNPLNTKTEIGTVRPVTCHEGPEGS